MKIFLMLGLAALLMAATLITGDVASAGSTDNPVIIVKIKNLAFSPAAITIRKGTTVRWINEDPFAHDVTSGNVVGGRKARQVSKSRRADGRFHSGAYGEGGRFEQTFDRVGSYPYFCTIHPIMTGVVKVER